MKNFSGLKRPSIRHQECDNAANKVAFILSKNFSVIHLSTLNRQLSTFLSIWQSEWYDLVCGSMVGPKVRAVKRKRATWKRNTRQVFHLRRFFARIETRNAPILVRRFLSAQDVDQAIDEHMSADLRTDINEAQNVSAPVEF
jgi:hypothetical protein